MTDTVLIIRAENRQKEAGETMEMLAALSSEENAELVKALLR